MTSAATNTCDASRAIENRPDGNIPFAPRSRVGFEPAAIVTKHVGQSARLPSITGAWIIGAVSWAEPVAIGVHGRAASLPAPETPSARASRTAPLTQWPAEHASGAGQAPFAAHGAPSG